MLSTLPHDARAHLRVWQARMDRLDANGRGWTHLAKTLAAEWGVSEGTVSRYYLAYKKSGITALLDQRKYARYLGEGAVRGLPQAFLEHWRSINERFQRNGGGKQSYRYLMDQLKSWRRGHAEAAIPGWQAPPCNQKGKLHPAGWSYENLTRHLPDMVERSLARQGRSAGKKYLPKVYTTRVGLVAVGYADGYPRHASTGTPVAVDGARTRLLGRVSMDMLTIDLTDLPHAGIGSTVELWGPYVNVTEVAKCAG